MIIYELVTDHKFTKVAEFLQEHFFKYAPLGLALGLTQSQVQRWFAPFIQAILNYSDPVSYVAMDEAGNIIGVLVGVVEDPDKPYPLPTMREYLDATKEPVMLQIVTLLELCKKNLVNQQLQKFTRDFSSRWLMDGRATELRQNFSQWGLRKRRKFQDALLLLTSAHRRSRVKCP
ncbi:uncharacterized protein LOC118434176 isoform X1 [Folsomia candida]|uniref:uncharacterized protein LOC118434176 isoform X1 n=1 Tax=Folsomia candida TaxID=158441 RepID=UPI001604DAD4|nr:uncharacterized protein LOC118434176 isoform X1 [Folsomia candida]